MRLAFRPQAQVGNPIARSQVAAVFPGLAEPSLCHQFLTGWHQAS